METRNIQDYTNLCIAHAKANGIELTHLKLQKVLYYLQAWSLVCLDNDSLFPDEPQAWVNGPVYRSVYDRFQGLGAEPIVVGGCVREEDAEELRKALTALGKSAKAEVLLAEVLEDYMPKSAGELVYRTHQERPWREARQGLRTFESGSATITHAAMRRYYQGLLSQQEAAAA